MTKVAVVMGSTSDWPTMQGAAQTLLKLGIAHDNKVISAHRMPDELSTFAKHARQNGYDVIIAGAGGAAHLPGMLAANTTVPVIGVPVKTRTLNGVDSLLSIVQMPSGVPVGTVAVGDAGATNAALYAAEMLAIRDDALVQKLQTYRQAQTQRAIESEAKLDD
ncbi:5-(carboxyamino)imidazole ribonucleotide mutase [Lacticaseibacillus songhuajiangensis]|uniref:5-(carboxyamino)imidazole ribonucleotide mutase n=1 Tax=Lacticaseibacillus songhuajiangensis TaxID=1296539 RepID=UPI000F768C0C|nr:5-(carboxyamino)imidazole ribonucleotide mutase [Lacticaseibacillus songhuajiangensis]